MVGTCLAVEIFCFDRGVIYLKIATPSEIYYFNFTILKKSIVYFICGCFFFY